MVLGREYFLPVWDGIWKEWSAVGSQLTGGIPGSRYCLPSGLSCRFALDRSPTTLYMQVIYFVDRPVQWFVNINIYIYISHHQPIDLSIPVHSTIIYNTSIQVYIVFLHPKQYNNIHPLTSIK